MNLLIGTYRANKDMMIDCLQSITDFSKGDEDFIFIDDSGDAKFRTWLKDFGEVVPVHPTESKQGFSKAMVTATRVMQEQEDEYVGWWEEDFTAVAPIDFDAMADNLLLHRDLAQIVLVRQPWFPLEIEAGSMLTHLCERMSQELVACPNVLDDEPPLLKHQMIFSTNPGVWSPLAYKWGWPDVWNSEERKTKYLVDDDDAWFAYWGEQETVHHDGERQGVGY